MDFICPSCKSENIQRLSIIYEGGISNINTKSKGTAIGFGSGGVGVGVGANRTTGTAQTAASQRAAPPVTKSYLKPLLVIFGVYMFVAILASDSGILRTLLAVGWLAASAGWTYFAFQYNSKTWPPLKAAWDDSYLCNRCNQVFLLCNS